MYTKFASVYDELMHDVRYPEWAAFYQRLLLEYGVGAGHVCECACGTGSITLELYRMGYDVCGVDLSPDMLFAASKKAMAAGSQIRFIQQDMRSLNLHRPQDAVLSTNDGLNYLHTDEDLLRFFRAAWRALKPGGVLSFDLSTPYKLTEVLGNHFIGDESPDISYLWQNRYVSGSDHVDLNLAIFVRQHDEIYERFVESQKQYLHSRDKLKQLLATCGFTEIRVFGDKRMAEPGPEEHRWFFAARRPAE